MKRERLYLISGSTQAWFRQTARTAGPSAKMFHLGQGGRFGFWVRVFEGMVEVHVNTSQSHALALKYFSEINRFCIYHTLIVEFMLPPDVLD